jgi:hypothetical protein
MPKAKHISKEMCLAAMSKTKSVKAAARYLNCSYQHLKKFMKAYKDESTGLSLFDSHKNQCGKGIPKFISHTPFGRKDPAIHDIVNGVVDASHFSPEKLKYRMLEAGILKEECYNCSHNERRVIDGKMPLLMHFKDGNKSHYGLNNVQLLCYNCYFLFVGSIFTDKDIERIEDHVPLSKTTEAVNFELDEYHMEKLRELGLYDTKVDDDPYSLVSRKK